MIASLYFILYKDENILLSAFFERYSQLKAVRAIDVEIGEGASLYPSDLAKAPIIGSFIEEGERLLFICVKQSDQWEMAILNTVVRKCYLIHMGSEAHPSDPIPTEWLVPMMNGKLHMWASKEPLTAQSFNQLFGEKPE